jgi:hypothetical protein
VSRARVLDLVLVSALAGLPLLAALRGAPGPRRVALNLGPGDGPYVSGFEPKYEIDEKVATHWTTYDARVQLPLAVRADGAVLSYRYARVLPQTAVVKVAFDGVPVDEFTARGGAVVERSVTVAAHEAQVVAVGVAVDSHDRMNRGLKLDWVRLDLPDGARLWLRGAARLRLAALVMLIFLLLRAAGWASLRAGALSAPWSAAAAFVVARDPWLAHRLLTGLPEALSLFGLAGVGLGLWLVRRGRLAAEDLRVLALLGVAAFTLRAALVNHPDFYYPDLMTHARLVGVVRDAGLDFFRAPAGYIGREGAWTKPAYGASAGLPYAVGFHMLFALLPVGYDGLITVMKLTAAAISVVPLLLTWGIARRLGTSTLAAVLMLLIPTYTSRLSFALLPALLGHAFDLLLVFWLAGHLERLAAPRVWLTGAMLVAAAQLAYVSSVTNVSLFVASLAVAVALETRDGKSALRVLGMGLAGAALAVLLYYRDFVGSAFALAPGILGGAGRTASRYPVEGWLALTYARTRDFFGWLYPPLAVAGLVWILRRTRGRPLVLAWLATYLLLLLLRAKVPDVFRYGHETLLVAPLVCLAAAEGLAILGKEGGARRVLAPLLLAALALEGAVLQWRAIADQLGNAL